MRGTLTALTLTLAALPACAQTTSPASLPAEAQAAVDKGVLAAKQQDFLLAVRYFQDARKIAPQAPEIYYDLGLAESKIPGRELRAIAWFGAYLTANPNAPNAAAVNDFVAGLHIKNQGNLNRLITIVQDAAGKADRGSSDEFNAYKVPALWAEAGDLAAALKTADLLKSQRSLAQEEIAEVQSSAGDFAGALKTAALIQDPVPKTRAEVAIAEAQIKAGNDAGANDTLVSALRTVDLIPVWLQPDKSVAQGAIAEAQAKAGNIAGAEKTASMMPLVDSELGNFRRSANGAIERAQAEVAGAQAKAGDIAGAQRTAELIQQDTGWKSNAEGVIAEAQAKAGDFAAAQKTSSLMVQNGIGQSYVQLAIVDSQLRAGDLTGAQRTADLMREGGPKSMATYDVAKAQKAIAEAQAKAGLTNNPASKGGPAAGGQASIQPIILAPVQPAIPVIRVADWLKKLDDESYYNDCALNTSPFLDFASYIKSRPPSDDPGAVFKTLHDTAAKLVRAQNVIDQMLKQQAKQ